jgi:hypothetical protein
MTLKLDKKFKYLIFSVIVSLLVLLYTRSSSTVYALAALVATFAGTLAVQHPYNKPKHILLNNILPMQLVLGSILTLENFPNLGLPVKAVFVIFMLSSFYIVSLINNVFLVVEEKNEIIPLYRVAVTWSQIIFITVAIPFFAGIFKLPVNPIVQSLVVSIASFMNAVYMIWILSFDSDSKKSRGVEPLLLGVLVAFFVFSGVISASFVPSESFLKALFGSSVLMFGLNYVNGYIKNNINKRTIYENFLITIIFFLLVFIFRN